jgi:hypothetical protein
VAGEIELSVNLRDPPKIALSLKRLRQFLLNEPKLFFWSKYQFATDLAERRGKIAVWRRIQTYSKKFQCSRERRSFRSRASRGASIGGMLQ